MGNKVYSDGLEHRVGRIFIIAGLAFLVGIFMAVQARINGQLGIALGNQIQAATISFLTGLTTLTIIMLLSKKVRLGVSAVPKLLKKKELYPWHLLGGIAGASYVMAQVYSVPLLGVALFTIVGVASESLSALLIDRLGLAPGGKIAITTSRVLASLIAFVAILLALFDRLDAISFSLLALTFVFLARIGTTVQVAFNSRVAVSTKSFLAATFISFLAGTVFLIMILAISLILGSKFSTEIQPIWMYSGGLIGVLAVATGTICIPRIGVLLYSLASTGGTVIGSIFIDLLAPLPNATVGTWTLVGSVLTLLSIYIGTLKVKN